MLFQYTKNLLYLIWQGAITAQIFVYSIFKMLINLCNHFVAPFTRKEKHAWL